MTSGDATTQPALQQKTEIPKLRLSCNLCGLAKVRCDRSRPECHRCIDYGLECIYGVSRKFGRRPRQKLCPPEDSAMTHGEPGLWPSDGPEHPAVPPPIEQSQEPNEDSLSFRFDDNSPPLGFELFDPLRVVEWPQLGLTTFGTNSAPLPEAPTANVGGHQILETGESHDNRNPAPLDSHSCARESYEIFADLICPAPNLHAPDSNSNTVTANLDQVLHFNRKAIKRLSRLLECPCAKSGHRVMVHASIISRILIWYQQAGGLNCTSPGSRASRQLDAPGEILSDASPSTSPSPSQCKTSPKTLPQTTGFVVVDVPASLGTFGIEDEKMQASIRNHLVLSEVKKISRLIDLFSSHISGELPASNAAGSLYVNTTAWLRDEYSSTIRVLQARRAAFQQSMGY
ncbi:hypothetical protein B0T25DRAFT_290203 [Lasiosphaeria hispida]|uniref:Zn(2)-C6 fungal-type domain-containing protein n=1 Tax=Lasiosphaeria hispida TaxID=260671 RepID=A0AAJ0MB24_9PEZI|nr:hypothetical protein B0T25DRAFT_290203 [Lasiosphaeria hispida]